MRNITDPLSRPWTVRELLEADLPEPSWLIPSLIPEGLTLLIGKPKIGKSWLVLQLAEAISTGVGRLGLPAPSPRKVLLFALEDRPRGLATRMNKLSFLDSPNLEIRFAWERGHEAIKLLESKLEEDPDIGVVIIDTWSRWSRLLDSDGYYQISDAASELKKLGDRYDVSPILVHHAKKGFTEDVMDSSLGSTGLPAVADTFVGLSRGRGERAGELFVTGRDVEDANYSLSFDLSAGGWIVEGTVEQVQATRSRREILGFIHTNGPSGPAELADGLEKNKNTVKTLLRKMVDDGSLINQSGLYSVP